MRTSRKPTVIAVFVTAVFASLVVGGAMASAIPPGGNFNVAYAQFPMGPGDFIHLYGWEPGSSLTISIDDPAVPGVDYEVTDIVVASAEGFNVDIGADFDIQSGHTVTVSDGSTSESLLVTNLEIRSVAPESGLVSGVGEPGMLTMVTPDYVTLYWVTPSADGTWQVDMGDYDFRLEGVAAQQIDDNGNSTQFDYLVTAKTPQSRADCKEGGWQNFTDDEGTAFRNQGSCVSYVATSGPQGSGKTPAHEYEFFADQLTWTDAAAYCDGIGAHLVTVTSAAENELVLDMTPPGPGGEAGWVWLGATDEVVEGDWRWVSGEPFTYTAWAPGEPNNMGGPGGTLPEHYLSYAHTAPPTPGWNDLPASSTLPFICESGG